MGDDFLEIKCPFDIIYKNIPHLKINNIIISTMYPLLQSVW